MASVAALYPQAKKCQYTLKALVDSIQSGNSSPEEKQQAIDEGNNLAQSIQRLENLLALEPANKRETWRIKIRQLSEEYRYMKTSLDLYLQRTERLQREARERDQLFARRPGQYSGGGVAVDYYQSEAASLKRSSDMVSDLSTLGRNALQSLTSQRSILKDAHRKVLDISNTLGLSSALLRVVERRDYVDRIIVFGGMAFVLLFFCLCIYFVRG